MCKGDYVTHPKQQKSFYQETLTNLIFAVLFTKMHFGCNLLYPASHHVMSSVSWALDSACVVFYRWSMATIHLSCTVMEVWSADNFGVRALTFLGHVTSSVTWPSRSSYVVFCNHASILHRYGDMEPQIFWGHDLDLLGSRDIIRHVTIQHPMRIFL